MARIFIDVEPTHSDGVRMWSVRVQGEAVRPKYPKKAEALAQGRKRGRAILAGGGLAEMRVKRTDGTYSPEGATYGQDPGRSRG